MSKLNVDRWTSRHIDDQRQHYSFEQNIHQALKQRAGRIQHLPVAA